MVIITLKIEEKKAGRSYSDCNIDINEKGILATKGETEISKILLNRIRINDKLQVIDSEDKDIADEIISKYFIKK